MSIWIILLLSLIQGSTEFLPVSSAAHLLLVEHWLKLPENTLAFDLALNLGTLLTIIFYFRKDIFYMFKELKEIITLKNTNYGSLLSVKLFIATLPVVVVGYLLVYSELYDIIRKFPLLLALGLIIFGIILYLADRFNKQIYDVNNISVKQSLFIGLFQCIALIPGVSRSGSTITGARILKIKRAEAVRFSFLMAIPSILGAIFLGSIHGLKQEVAFNYIDIILGAVFTFIFGLLFIKVLLGFISKHNFFIFMLYRAVIGILIIWLIVG